MLVSPYLLEQLAACRRDDLLREAAAERLAQQVCRSSGGARARSAAVLYALAAWLDPRRAAAVVAEADRPTPVLTA